MLHRYTQGTLIAANARLGRQLRREYAAERRRQGAQVWESPDVIPRNAWIERAWLECVYRDPVSTPLLLGPWQEQALWEQAIAESDADNVLLDLPATASEAARAWDLVHSWEARIDPAEFAGLRDPEAYLEWMRRVETRLRDQGWITASELPRALAEKLAAGTLALPQAVAHTGFDELTPADRRLFDACGAAESAAPASTGSRASRAAFDSAPDELMRAAAWARRKLEAAPSARLGVVVRGLAAQSATVERIFDDILHPGLDFARAGNRRAFHVSAGVLSNDVPMISAALLALRLHSGMSLAEAGMLLRSPFLRLGRSAGAKLDGELRRQGVEQVSLGLDIVRRAFPGMAKATDELRARMHPGEWSSVFSKLLTQAGWPGDRPLSSVEYQTLEHWKELLSDLASLDLVLPRITYEQALSRLRRIARERRFAPDFTAHDASHYDAAPIQIMDMPDAAGSRFDALWIAGLNANAWPEAPRPNPFLPASLQRAAGLPHGSPERELAHARRVTARLLASAPEVTCSFARYSGEEPLRVSPLIETLPEIPDAPPPPETVPRRIFGAGAPLEDQPRGPAPALPAGVPQRGGMSVLRDQAACPFRAFATHRLGARELDAPDLGISKAERGTVAHEALDLLWQQLNSQTELLALLPREIALLVGRCVSAALDTRLSRRQRSKSFDRSRALEQERWERLLLEWLEEEKRRPPFEVVEREVPRKVEAGGLAIEIKADRLDRFPDGTYGILDYKTSDKLSVKDWDGERPDAPQLPLYAAKSGRDVSAVYFAQLVPGESRRLGIEGKELKARLPEWTRVVDQLGANFLRGDAAVDPKHPPKTCEFCMLHSLCRIAELREGVEIDE